MKTIKNIIKSIIVASVILAISIFTNKTYAAELAVSASGNNVTISSEYTGRVNISVSGGTASESSIWLENSSQTISISGVASSGATVTVTPVSMSDSDGNPKTVKAKSVNIAGTTTTKTDSNKNDEKKTTTEKEKEPTFKSVKEEMYATGNINVRKSYSADSDKLGSLTTGEKITRTGIGDNGWSKVTYNGSTGYVKTSLLTKEEPKKSEDKSLKSLSIEGVELEPEFDPEITDYTVVIGENVTSLKITAETNDEKASYEVTGNDKLEGTDNIIKITVKAEDGTTRIYSITASKKAKVSTGLTALKVNGYSLSPSFSPEVKEYKVTILDANVNKVDVTATTGIEKAKVETTGNNDLKNGENTVVVKVLAEDGSVIDTYKIIITKNATTTAVGNTNNKKSNTILYAGIGIIVVLVIAIIIVIVMAKRNAYYDEEDEEDEDDDEKHDESSNTDNSDLYGSFSDNKDVDEGSSIYGDFSAKAINQRAEETEEKTKYEDNFTNNEYNSRDIYGSSSDYTGTKDVDYYSSKVSELFDKSESQTDKASGDAFGYLPSDDTMNDFSDNNYPVPSDNDWNDDDYRPRRSKGKHAK